MAEVCFEYEVVIGILSLLVVLSEWLGLSKCDSNGVLHLLMQRIKIRGVLNTSGNNENS